MVFHKGKRVALRECIYRIIRRAHLRSNHGGRDKTSARVKHNYSWLVSSPPPLLENTIQSYLHYFSRIPKDLVARFVKNCPHCQRRRGETTVQRSPVSNPRPTAVASPVASPTQAPAVPPMTKAFPTAVPLTEALPTEASLIRTSSTGAPSTETSPTPFESLDSHVSPQSVPMAFEDIMNFEPNQGNDSHINFQAGATTGSWCFNSAPITSDSYSMPSIETSHHSSMLFPYNDMSTIHPGMLESLSSPPFPSRDRLPIFYDNANDGNSFNI